MPVVPAGKGRYRVSGPLEMETVPLVTDKTRGMFQGASRVVIDLGGVTSADSAAMALIVDWMREARRAGAELHFENVPAPLLAIAKAARLEHLLP